MIGWIVACGAVVVVALGAFSFRASVSNPAVLLFLVLGMYQGVRMVLIGTGVDTPYPEHVFEGRDIDHMLLKTAAVLALFVTATFVGMAVWGRGRSSKQRWSPFVSHQPTLRAQLMVASATTLLAALISAALVARYGGPSGMIRAAKFDKALAGLFPLRVPASLGTVLGAAILIDAAHQRKPRLVAVGVLLTILNGGFVMLWGARSSLVVGFAVVLVGMVFPASKTIDRTVLPKLALVALVVFGVAFGLRASRELSLNGELMFAEDPLARRLSLATNAIALDSALLVVNDVGDRFEQRDGVDFVNGFIGPVPRAIWAGKPASVTPGVWIRQSYEPSARNGWPPGAPAMWFLNFGWLGVVVGGLLAGSVYRFLAQTYARATACGVNVAISVTAALSVFPMGIDPETPLRAAVHAVPLLLAVMAMAQLDRRAVHTTSRREPTFRLSSTANTNATARQWI